MQLVHFRFIAILCALLCVLSVGQQQTLAQATATADDTAAEESSKDDDKDDDEEEEEEEEEEKADAKEDGKGDSDKDGDKAKDKDSDDEKEEAKSDSKPTPKKPKVDPRVKRIAEMEAEMKELKAEAALAKARQDAELNEIKLELERISAEASLESARRKKATATFSLESDLLAAENALLKQKFAKLKQESDLASLENMSVVSEITRDIALADNREKAKSRVLKAIEYKSQPFRGGELHISDRRIPLNGVITARTANYITERIHFFNNQSDDPIFIVIDDSPGGSVMAGYRILKAMEASDAPIHVVVKSFAASMAATITTLAEHSYAYPNAILLHHQMSSFLSGNMTEQAEQLEVNQEWARRLMGPLCDKLETTPEKFVKEMYENSSTGDWEEFADRACELKWVGNIVSQIREESVVKRPTTTNSSGSFIIIGGALEPLRFDGTEEVDEQGNRFKRLPRLHPFDCYFVHNPDGYYRF
ncbi:MAG TPA: peptidase S14 [Planctomycetaceae bacterium]|nr:peptidase S14 [Planctomycetaceae bacterium]